MKIVIVGPAHPYRGGIAALNDRLAQAFVDEGHEVSIESFSLQYPGWLFPGKSQFTTGAPPHTITTNRTINSINPVTWAATGKRIRTAKPDLVILRFWIPFMGPALGTIGRLIRRNHQTTVIALTDNIIPHEKKPGDRMLTRYFLGAVHGVIAMSESVLNDLDRLDKAKPRRWGPHPIYDHYGQLLPRTEALEKLGLESNKNYLLFFGLIRDYKGLDLLLEALADSRLKELQVHVLVAGEFYSNEDKYRQQVEDLGIAAQVTFINRYIPDQEVENYFSAADMVVQPYRSATQSGVTQVAYHFDKPMLVTNVGGLAEIVGHNKGGYVCQPDPKEIADAVFDFYTHNRKSAFEAHVRKEKKRFSWNFFTHLFFSLMIETGPVSRQKQ